MTDEYLWPARNVAEYAYCPRLFYFMEVEGIYLPSADTEQGNAVHRKVHRPGGQFDAERITDQEGPRVIRSLTLTSQDLRLTATIDLVEISDNIAVPVEYRKGYSKHNIFPSDTPKSAARRSRSQPEAWPVDRVQIGLQAILLKEAGYKVTRAVVYYAAEKLRLEIPVDASLEAEALAIFEAAKACAKGPRPLPLVNDSRCPRCSLHPVCLPDEINHQRVAALSGEKVRLRSWPPRDDGIHVVAQTNGSKISVKGMTLVIKNYEGITLKEIPLTNIETLSLLGSVQISTQALHALADRGVPVAYLSPAGRLIAMVDPLDPPGSEVIRAQIKKLESPDVCLELARALIAAKITNQRTLLMRNSDSLPKRTCSELARLAINATKANSLDNLRGLEGRAAAIYFSNFARMLKNSIADEFDANGRQRRPPPDPINSCLSMAYSILTNECTAALRLAGLVPSIGAYHVSRPGRPALALDLMEPFRPLIADSVSISAFNRNELCEGHFIRTPAGCMFTDNGRKAFFNAYARRMDVEISHPVLEYRVSYRRMLVLHARMIAAWFLGEIPTLSFLTTR